MPINSVHPEYAARSPQWSRSNDAYRGTDAVKAAGAKYLPRLEDQTDEQYSAYRKRALYYGATARTVEGVTGSIMRIDPDVKVSPAIDPYLDDITFTGVSFREFTKSLVSELFLSARAGILIDRRAEGDTRPYFSLYTALNIINWNEVDGILVLVVLREMVTKQKDDDPYVWEEVERFRELLIEDGKYVQKLHTRKAKGSDEFTTETMTPTKKGQSLTEIPFVFVTPEGLTIKTQKPPILDLSDVNLSHYLSSADLEHGRHFTALPTIYFTGVTPKQLGGAINIGSGTAAVLEPAEARAGIIEFKGEGLGALVTALEQKEAMMGSLGARLLLDQRKGVEAAETARIHAQGEMSVAMTVSLSAGDGLARALVIMSEWEGQNSGDVSVTLNKDFISIHLDAQTLAALTQARQAGEISQTTYLYNLKRGEMLPPDTTVEEEAGIIGLEGGTGEGGIDDD